MKILLAFLLMLAAPLCHAAPTTLSVVTLSETAASLAASSADTTNGNQIRNRTCDLFLVLENIDESDSATVTVAASGSSFTVPGVGATTKSNASVSLSATQKKHIGPFRCKGWNDSSGYVQLTYSGVASSAVRVSPLRLPTTF